MKKLVLEQNVELSKGITLNLKTWLEEGRYYTTYGTVVYQDGTRIELESVDSSFEYYAWLDNRIYRMLENGVGPEDFNIESRKFEPAWAKDRLSELENTISRQHENGENTSPTISTIFELKESKKLLINYSQFEDGLAEEKIYWVDRDGTTLKLRTIPTSYDENGNLYDFQKHYTFDDDYIYFYCMLQSGDIKLEDVYEVSTGRHVKPLEDGAMDYYENRLRELLGISIEIKQELIYKYDIDAKSLDIILDDLGSLERTYNSPSYYLTLLEEHNGDIPKDVYARSLNAAIFLMENSDEEIEPETRDKVIKKLYNIRLS